MCALYASSLRFNSSTRLGCDGLVVCFVFVVETDQTHLDERFVGFRPYSKHPCIHPSDVADSERVVSFRPIVPD